MHVLIKSRSVSGPELRSVVEERLRSVLSRFAGRVARTTVCVVDVNGPRGGVDKRCLVELRAGHRRKVVASSHASDWRVALELALGRAATSLHRLLQRSRRGRRSGAAQRPPGHERRERATTSFAATTSLP